MAANGRQFLRSAQRFSRNISSSANVARSSRTLTGNLVRKPQCSTSKLLCSQDTALLNTAKKQINKMEMRQLQRSVAILSLSAKVSTCLNLAVSTDGDVTDGSEDSDDVCSQPGHKQRKNRWIESYNTQTL